MWKMAVYQQHGPYCNWRVNKCLKHLSKTIEIAVQKSIITIIDLGRKEQRGMQHIQPQQNANKARSNRQFASSNDPIGGILREPFQ